MLEYCGLFIAGFLSATVVPASSEIVVAALVTGGYSKTTIILVATAGNSLGSLFMYYLGYLGKWEWIERYCRMSRERLERFQEWSAKYGGWLATLIWIPIIGDFIAVALGLVRSPLVSTMMGIIAGKLLRYLVIVWLVMRGVDWFSGP